MLQFFSLITVLLLLFSPKPNAPVAAFTSPHAPVKSQADHDRDRGLQVQLHIMMTVSYRYSCWPWLWPKDTGTAAYYENMTRGYRYSWILGWPMTMTRGYRYSCLLGWLWLVARAGNSLICFLSESLVFCKKWANERFTQKNEQFAHFW